MTPSAWVQAANTLLLHLAGTDLPVPQPQPALDGQFTRFAELPLALDGHRKALHAVRLLTYLPGTLLSELPAEKLVKPTLSLIPLLKLPSAHCLAQPPQTQNTWFRAADSGMVCAKYLMLGFTSGAVTFRASHCYAVVVPADPGGVPIAGHVSGAHRCRSELSGSYTAGGGERRSSVGSAHSCQHHPHSAFPPWHLSAAASSSIILLSFVCAGLKHYEQAYLADD